MSNVGWTVQKYSHMQNQAMPQHMQKPYYRQKFWLIGFIIYAIGNVGDFVALAFAAQSLVAPLGSVVLVVNAIMSPWILKERITSRDIQAVMLIIVGDVLIVLYASHEETSYSLNELIDFFTRPAFLAFLIITVGFCLFLAHKKDQLDLLLDPNRASYYDSKDEHEADKSTKWVSDEAMHPYTYAALAGIVGGLSVLLAKCVAELVKVTIEGDSSQFHNPVSWLFTVALLITCIAQVHWINQGLERYDSFYIVPMFHVHWNIWSILGGIVFFNEFQTFTAINYGLFLLGVTCILVGVAYLAQREMQNQTHVNKSKEPVIGEDTDPLIPKTPKTVQ